MRDTKQHYAHGALESAILEVLREAGKDPDRLTLDDLAPVDEFHVRGREATKELAAAIGLAEGMRVLDVGCGIGGPSRRLASDYGCRVTGLDLTEEYCRVAEALSVRLNLQDLVSYRTADALVMPFDDSSFDVVWTQHASMNIADKNRLYAEIYRVLKPGGHLALYDVLAGPGGDVYFPVPWARDSSISFLVTEDALLASLERAGFDVVSCLDTTGAGGVWLERAVERFEKNGIPPLSNRVLLGDEFPIMVRNLLRNIKERRMRLVQLVARRAAA
ncbi:class I SAM-dependent methyltransferase [Arhodomonas sp. AD133]|uniref:class I SAM-dependent methyltransferase n=1 Tax=Arhodomonas sp. AD133 TaxID=3415009 RepID=UPI003EBB9D06